MVKKKNIVIIAGPNGAGKTTFAKEFLPNEAGCPIFVNADLIAAGLSPFFPEHAAFRAGRLMYEEIKTHLLRNDSFAFETTLSGKIYAQMIPEWQKRGYTVKLIFLSLHDVKIAIERVKGRVLQGGHNVPEEIIRRRFGKGWFNFYHIYKQLVDTWILYDNSGRTPKLLEEGEKR
ncbi:MAG: zeta toxin family protein [Planctomycetia bacterium]|uniref:zeta toxin family protein n=1 Tax=Candidatus Kuenenia sp. TaxID=2499824 RepID=UPI001DA98B83|nr:zeta toxin family protein [Planctomycetia bacterium]